MNLSTVLQPYMKCPIQVFNFSIRNAGNDSVDIHIDGDIVDASTQDLLKAWFGDETSVSFKSFRNQINAVDARVYNIYINSYGGLVTDAMAMHDFLNELESKGKTVNRIGRGIIASSATYILTGPNSSMTRNSWYMIHNVSGGVWGDVDTVENYAVTLRKFNNRSRDFYSEQTTQRKEEITKMMNSETWMTADEAFEKGFVKQVIGAANFTNKISKENWQYSNMAVLNAYNEAVKPPPDNSVTQKLDDMKKLFQDLGTSILNAIKGVKAPENNDHATLMTSIGEAVQKSFESSAGQLETAVSDLVNTSISGKQVQDAIALQANNAATAAIDFIKDGPAKTALDTAVTNATKDYAGKITALETAKTDLEKKNGELELEITNMKGKKSVVKDDDAPEPIGTWQ